MERLTQIWKKLQFEMAARDIFDPPRSVIREMEKEGWKFEYRHNIASNTERLSFYTQIIPIPPQKDVADNRDITEQYRTARRKAAERVYGMK